MTKHSHQEVTRPALSPSSLIFGDVQVDLRAELQGGPQVVDRHPIDVNVSVAEEGLSSLAVKNKLDDAGIFAEAASDSAKKVAVLQVRVHFEGQDLGGLGR